MQRFVPVIHFASCLNSGLLDISAAVSPQLLASSISKKQHQTEATRG